MAHTPESEKKPPRGAQASDFLDKDFKLAVINTLEETKGTMTSKAKGKTDSVSPNKHQQRETP